MTTITGITPFESRTINLQSLPLRVCESLAVDRMIREAGDYEAAMAKLGSGCPPMDEAIHVALMWQSICEFVVEGEA
jgi:hypothetical protein